METMRTIPLYAYTGLSLAARADLERDVQAHHTLAEILAWGRAQSPPLTVSEILTQDEYTHDVVVRIGDRLVLVYDTT